MNKIEVTRANPALIVFMVDMSGSMSENILFEDKLMQKNEALSRIVNSTLTEIIYTCRRGGEYRDYFNFVVLGYDGGGVASLLEKYNTTKSDFTNVQDLINSNTERVPYHKNVDGTLSDTKFWEFVKIGAMERTPMFEALTQAYNLGKKWIASKTISPSPLMFINITDGGATDACDKELIDIAKKIKSLRTAGGQAILMNIHISTVDGDKTIIFPRDKKGLDAIKNADLLYEMASELPEWMSEIMSNKLGLNWVEGDKYRALGYNTLITQLFDVLQIGTISK